MSTDDDKSHSKDELNSNGELTAANNKQPAHPTTIASSYNQGASTSWEHTPRSINLPSEMPRHSRKRKTAETEYTKNSKERRRESPSVDLQPETQVISSAREQNNCGGNSESEEEDEDAVSRQKTSTFAGIKYAASGLKQTLHGNIYQLKLLMLFVKRGLQKGYDWSVATEMVAAEKFDDVVFRYEDKATCRTVCRYLQAKHSQDGSRSISASDLLNETDGDFSIQKYFVSYRRIKTRSKDHPDLIGSEFEDCVICTNIDFDFSDRKREPWKFRLATDEYGILLPKDLEVSQIGLEKLGGSDAILDVKNSSESSARYKLVLADKHDLYEILRESSDAYLLAKTLATHVFNKKKITLFTKIFKFYHTALATQVFDLKEKCFLPEFINNDTTLSGKVRKFRKIFGAELLKLMKSQVKTVDEETMWLKIKDEKLAFSEMFGKEFQSKPDKLIDMHKFAEAFVRLIKKAKNNHLIVIDRKIYKQTAEQGSDERYIGINIDKLANGALIVKDKVIRFNSEFFQNATHSTLSQDMNSFRTELKKILDEQYKDLKKYRFVVKNSPQHWDLLFATHQLPDDNVEDDEIRDFFEKLIFAVNQPNEVELGEIIRKEFGEDSRFNVLSADLVSNSFLTEILDWFKKKGGVFFRAEDGETFFKSMEEQVGNLISAGLSSSYPEVLERYGIEFMFENQELKDFLNNRDEQVLRLITAGKTLPVAIATCRTIRKTTESKKDYSLIFMQLCTLLPEKTKQLVIRSFESPRRYDLLVIDCESPNIDDLQSLHNLYDELCKKIMKENSAKKLILITQTINESNFTFKNCKQTPFEVRFNSLSKDSREKLLNKQIINFQGLRETPISFCKLFGNCSVSEHLTDFGDVIDSSTLVDLICGDEITLGDELNILDKTEDFYIDRTFNSQVCLKADIFRSDLEYDVFAVSGIALQELLGLVMDRRKIRSFSEKSQSCNFIILDKECDIEQFGKLCSDYSSEKYNIHWLKIESGKLMWKQSQGCISNLIEYREVDYRNVDETTTANGLTEDALADVHKDCKVVIISDTAGMGKSTVFTSLARKIKKKKPDRWVFKIDLNNFGEVLEKEKHPNYDELFVKLAKLKTDLEKEVLRRMIECCGGAVLLVDGFDEIESEYMETAKVMLKGIKNSIGVEKLFVSTRPHFGKTLEEGLQTFSYTIDPFSKEHQHMLLSKFWKKKLKLECATQEDNERLGMYAEALITKVANTIGNRANKFLGIPLQTRMVAEIYQENIDRKDRNFDTCKEFLELTTVEPRLPTKMNIVDLYEHFVENKYNIFYKEKVMAITSNSSVEQMKREHRRASREMHQKFALHTLFNAEGVKTLLNKRERSSLSEYIVQIIEGHEKIGIINDKSQFIHRSFAEYFVAVFLNSKLSDSDCNQKAQEFIIGQILLHREYNIIRTFLNGLLTVSSSPCDSLNERDEIADGGWKPVLEDGYRKNKQTIFHTAVQERNDEILKFFLNRFGTKHEIAEFLNNTKDKSGRTAMCVAAIGQHWNQLKLLVESGGADVNCCDCNGETPLHWAAFSGSQPMVKWLVENKADLHAKSNDNRKPLHSAARSGQLEVLEWLIHKTGVPVDSLLHDIGIADAPFTVFKWLVDERKANLQDRDDCRKSVLCKTAVLWGRADVVKWLVSIKGVKLEREADKGTELIRLAVKGDHWEIVKCLVESSAFDITDKDIGGSTVLKCAIKRASLDDIKWFVEKKSIDVNAELLVHSSAECGRLNVLRWLVTDQSADLTKTDASDKTVLHYAAAGGSLDTIKFLIETGEVDVSDRDTDNRTAWDLYHERLTGNSDAAILRLLTEPVASQVFSNEESSQTQ